MSAALQLPLVPVTWTNRLPTLAASGQRKPVASVAVVACSAPETQSEPVITWAFYRKHTQNLLRRYLYASLQVGRTPSLLGESVGRGWVSSRRVRTFEDALIFVLDVERCLNRLPAADLQMITRVLLQEYTYAEAAPLLGVSLRTVCSKLPQAIDRLTEHLVTAGILVLPD